MSVTIRKAAKIGQADNLLYLFVKGRSLADSGLSQKEMLYVKKQIKGGRNLVAVNQLNRWILTYEVDTKRDSYKVLEDCRKAGHQAGQFLNKHFLSNALVVDGLNDGKAALAAAEGMVLGNYQFLKYFKDKKKRAHSLNKVSVHSANVPSKQIGYVNAVIEGNTWAKTLVNEPLSYLTATQLSKEIQKMGREAGFKVEVLNHAKIKSLKMGGLLSVNLGSPNPPTFNILTHKPKNSKNKQPIVLVGKGVVYDTGGLSLKPTANSMDMMKCDMAGAAAVAGALYSIAKAKLPVHVVGLIPATENRPDGNAYVPGDVIKMHNGSTVEVLNTDAEGRLILADALSYAQKYNPKLVIDLATLTGAAMRAVGIHGICSMGSADEKTQRQVEQSGYQVHERLAPMPFWDEYAEDLKSSIADMKNIGGAAAGAITAGKFLEHFILAKDGKSAYPWIHLDIAGPAFIAAEDQYRSKGGTGVGVRLLFDYLKNQ